MVERGETFNYSNMETINWSIPLDRNVKISIEYPSGIAYNWKCSSGNPSNFNSSSLSATVYANSNSTSPIIITASAIGGNLTQTFRLYLKNTYSIMNDNSSILNINLENQETNNLFLQERDLIHDTSDKKHHSMCSSPEELVAPTCPYVNNLPDKIFDLQNI